MRYYSWQFSWSPANTLRSRKTNAFHSMSMESLWWLLASQHLIARELWGGVGSNNVIMFLCIFIFALGFFCCISSLFGEWQIGALGFGVETRRYWEGLMEIVGRLCDNFYGFVVWMLSFVWGLKFCTVNSIEIDIIEIRSYYYRLNYRSIHLSQSVDT